MKRVRVELECGLEFEIDEDGRLFREATGQRDPVLLEVPLEELEELVRFVKRYREP